MTDLVFLVSSAIEFQGDFGVAIRARVRIHVHELRRPVSIDGARRCEQSEADRARDLKRLLQHRCRINKNVGTLFDLRLIIGPKGATSGVQQE
jgi:hypothetical protein